MTLEPVSRPPLPGAAAPSRNIFVRYFARFDDGEVLRWAFRGLLIGTIAVLVLDLRDLSSAKGWIGAPETDATALPDRILPPAVETNSPLPSSDPRKFVTADESVLLQPMVFTLEPGGVLKAEGSIELGTAARFEAEIVARGEYVKTVSLNSPGGALDDAMAMAAMVRQRGIGTEVADGALCASSCPLLFAGGKVRHAGEKAAIGVHQFYATSASGSSPEQVMADAQITTARISRHLAEMGVDPALWLHALDTPPRALYYLSPAEMTDFRLVTTDKVAHK